MGSSLVALFLLLGTVSSDRLRFHLENLVNWDVSACDDFYHHACSQKADPNEFFWKKMETMFQGAVERLRPEALKNSPIEFDLQLARTSEYKLEDNNYANLARSRCARNMSCYIDDYEFYRNYTTALGLDHEKANKTSTSSSEDAIIADTSAQIDSLITFLDNNSSFALEGLFNDSIHFHNALQTRTSMIEFMKGNRSYTDFHDIMDVAEDMKNRMISHIQNSTWLYSDEIAKLILRKITERIASIKFFHDFDEIDKNLTIVLKMNRDFNEAYFSYSRKTGVRGLDALLSIDVVFKKMVVEAELNPEFGSIMYRIFKDFAVNAFYLDPNLVTLFAPFMHRIYADSHIIKEPIITYFVLGHELYHSLFSPTQPTLINVYANRSECVAKHYQKTCQFAMGACGSGKQTITEDAPDLESLRMVHGIMTDIYSVDELAKKIDGLETTLEQAFFYYAASTWCEQDTIRTEEKAKNIHSAANIRINAAFSLMPEFTKAFGCQKGQEMYVEEKDSCYVFGPNSK